MAGVSEKQKKTMAAAGYLSEDILPEIFKRLPIESLNRFKCVAKSWYHLIHSPYVKALHYNNHRQHCLYMLVRHPIHVCALYRFDPLHDPQHLLPLLVFPRSSTNHQLSLIKLGSKIYIFGLPEYWHPEHNPERSIYTIDEWDLLDIKPSFDNTITKFKHIFTKTMEPMRGDKYKPILFVANGKLYVLSRFSGENMFEVFCPVHKSWQVLPSPNCYFMSEDIYFVVVEQEQMVYFSTATDLVSFNLETHKWWTIHSNTPVEPFGPGWKWTCHDASICVPIIRGLAFRYFDVDVYNPNYICACKTYCQGEELLLAPDEAFLEELSSSRFTYMSENSCSEYMIGLQDCDGTQVLCIVTYGHSSLDLDYTINHVALSFFDITGDFYTSEDRPLHANDFDDIFQAEDGDPDHREPNEPD
ncbi:hypothetical protein ACET3Z_020572 [Daucus carota]